jgi:hypothetical protein
MAYTALTLIDRAWNLSGIVARNLETVSGDQSTEGLFLLNELLDFKAADLNLIPYFRLYNGVFVQGQEQYDITGLVEIQTMTFTMNNQVRYPMTWVPRDYYFGSGRVNNIQSIPYIYHTERQLNGTRVYVYYLPMDNYAFQISGKFALTDVLNNTDMSTVYDGFYMAYLRYALAEKMCMEYDIAFDPDKKAYLMRMEKLLQQTSPPDLTIKKPNFLGKKRALDWQTINISRGYLPY